ncbi:hypothetical protein GCM10007159_38730 [Modicisalibacter luteus]|nr:hypothetical protein GCM10007159_38730 [Halomonas lutea]
MSVAELLAHARLTLFHYFQRVDVAKELAAMQEDGTDALRMGLLDAGKAVQVRQTQGIQRRFDVRGGANLFQQLLEGHPGIRTRSSRAWNRSALFLKCQ